MKFELNEWKAQLTDEEILTDIQEVAKCLKTDYLSISTYKVQGKYSQTAIQAHFGTWRQALTLAGLRCERNSNELKLISDEDYYADLRRVAKLINNSTVPYEDYVKYGEHSASYIYSRFGKWNDCLIKAGLEPTGFNKDMITIQECFDEIERMWRLLGRQPTATDIIKNRVCKYSIDTFKRRFGGWRKALEAFVEYINTTDSDEYEPYSPVPDNSDKYVNKEMALKNYPSGHRTSRNINTRLRFRVLARDNFKCCACGASPAKDPSVELHVDHIIPWSKGGETEFDNLQTLCSKCNLGKGNIIPD